MFNYTHRWNRNPRPQPQKFDELEFLVCVGESYICLNWLSGALVEVGVPISLVIHGGRRPFCLSGVQIPALAIARQALLAPVESALSSDPRPSDDLRTNGMAVAWLTAYQGERELEMRNAEPHKKSASGGLSMQGLPI